MFPSSRSCRLLGLMLLAVTPGCSKHPRAPSLAPETVYQNDKIGLRFLAPDGWPMAARADLPAGALTKPIVLVTYLQSQASRPAEFQLMAVDLPVDTDLAQYLAEHQIGSGKWAINQAPESVTIHGETAVRYAMSRGSAKSEVRREATVFRRGGRAFFFIVTFGTTDTERRDQVRKSVESVTWSK